MSHKKQLKQMLRDAEEQGWNISSTKSGHLKWIFQKTGGFFFSGSTLGDHRAFKNILSNMRRIEKTTTKTVVGLAFLSAALCVQSRDKSPDTAVGGDIVCDVTQQGAVPVNPQKAFG